jgi:glycerophosphoryl diester phosphodiesterase
MAVPPFLDHRGPIAFAHRGAHDLPTIGENTMAAFARAVELGYRYVETDVHTTSDGVLLAFHDDRLDRVTDRSGKIAELPWRVVGEARVGGEPIPRLEDLLGSFPDLRINIDPKHDASVEPLVEVLRRTDAVDRVCIGSFSDRRIATLRAQLGPRLCTSLGPRGVARLRAASVGLPSGRFVDRAAQVPVRAGKVRLVDERFVRAAHRHAIEVHVWTIDDPDEMDELLDLGVDGIMTDRPVELRAVLERRGQWTGEPSN